MCVADPRRGDLPVFHVLVPGRVSRAHRRLLPGDLAIGGGIQPRPTSCCATPVTALVVGSVSNSAATFTTVGGVGSEWNFHTDNPTLLA